MEFELACSVVHLLFFGFDVGSLLLFVVVPLPDASSAFSDFHFYFIFMYLLGGNRFLWIPRHVDFDGSITLMYLLVKRSGMLGLT